MSSIIKLEKGEKIIWIKHPSLTLLLFDIVFLTIGIVGIYFILKYVNLLSGLVILVLLASGVFVLAVIALAWLCRLYILTDKKVASKIGIFGKKYEEISLADVQGVDLDQSFWGMILGYGTLTISAAGTNNWVKFENISRVKQAEQEISDLI